MRPLQRRAPRALLVLLAVLSFAAACSAPPATGGANPSPSAGRAADPTIKEVKWTIYINDDTSKNVGLHAVTVAEWDLYGQELTAEFTNAAAITYVEYKLVDESGSAVKRVYPSAGPIAGVMNDDGAGSQSATDKLAFGRDRKAKDGIWTAATGGRFTALADTAGWCAFKTVKARFVVTASVDGGRSHLTGEYPVTINPYVKDCR